MKVNNFDNVAKDSLDEWIYFFKNSEVKDSFTAKGIQKAKEELREINLTREEMLEYEGFVHNWRVRMGEGEIEMALRDGRREGKQEGKLEIAQKLIVRGDSDNEIAAITGFSIEQIQQLQ